MHVLSGFVLVAASLYLIGLTVLVFAKPALAERFFMGFASSARTHFVEQILRVLLGGSLVIYSTSMWQTAIFRLIGWAIVVSSFVLILLPWQWHQRFGKKILPIFIQRMKLYAIGTFAFGAIIIYSMLAPEL